MSLDEFRKDLDDPVLKERFYDEISKKFNLPDRASMAVVRHLLNDVVVREKPNDWCVLKTLYARAKIRISLNEFHYSVVPNLTTIGLLEMKMSISPTGKYKRVVRLCESFVSDILYPVMKGLK